MWGRSAALSNTRQKLQNCQPLRVHIYIYIMISIFSWLRFSEMDSMHYQVMWLESRVKKSDFEHLKECFCFECDIKTSTPLRRNSKLGTVPWKDLKAASALMANGASQALAVCILCSLQLGWILSRKAWVTLIRPGQIWNRRPNWRFLRSAISESKSIWRNDFSIIFWIGLVHSKLSLKLTRTGLSSYFRVRGCSWFVAWQFVGRFSALVMPTLRRAAADSRVIAVRCGKCVRLD